MLPLYYEPYVLRKIAQIRALVRKAKLLPEDGVV